MTITTQQDAIPDRQPHPELYTVASYKPGNRYLERFADPVQAEHRRQKRHAEGYTTVVLPPSNTNVTTP